MTNRENWQKIESIFHEAIAVPEDQRMQVIDAQCGDDRWLKTEVLSLVQSLGQGDGFLEPNILGSPTVLGSTLQKYADSVVEDSLKSTHETKAVPDQAEIEKSPF